MYKKIVFLSLSILFSLLTHAQDTDSLKTIEYTKPGEYVIDTIVITGVKFLDQKVLVNMSGLVPGTKISLPGEVITNTIRKFWDHGLFEDVKVSVNMLGNGKVKLNIYLKERPRISKFNIDGIGKSDADDLKEKLKIRAGMQVTDNVINDAIIVIKKFYIEKGFFNVAVNVKQDVDSVRQNSVRLTLQIAKNKRVKISEIYIKGNKEVDTKKLLKAMKKTKRRDWKFWNSSKYIESQYKEDKGFLIDYYNEKGYRDAKILSDSIKILSHKRIALYINLNEGKKYYFRNTSWIGNTKYPSDYLTSVLGLKKGDVFDQKVLNKRLQEDEDAVSSLYLDNGYLFFNVTPVEAKIDNDSIDFEMRIYEGKQATINNILISGNTKTNEHVVRRELRTMPGELFSKSDIVRSVRELATLGHFEPEKIQPVPMPNPENSTVDIEYKLVERANDQLEVSGGWGGYYGFIGTVGIRFSNFSYRNFFKWKEWRPVPSGDGQSLSFRLQSNGTYYRSISASFSDPWFGGKKPTSLSVSAYLNRIAQDANAYSSSNYRMTTYGLTVGLGKRLKWPDDYFSIQHQVNFEVYDLLNYGGQLGLKFGTGTLNNINYSITLSRNSLDQFIYPRSGSSFSLSLQLTPPFSLLRANNFWVLNAAERVDLIAAENARRLAEKPQQAILNATQEDNLIAEKEDAAKYKWVEYHKWTFKTETYTSLVGNLVLMTGAKFGYLGRYSKKLDYSPVEKFEMGGSGMSSYSYFNVDIVPMRGYEDRSISASSSSSNDYYSNIYNKYTMELRYPITLKEQATIFGAVFAEAGNSWKDIKSFNPFEVKRTAGFGVRVFLPMFGLLGFDLGYGFDKVWSGGEYKKGSWQPQFTMGQQF